MYRVSLLVLGLGMLGGVQGVASEPTPRRVYVLHSGLHTILSDPWKNIAADTLRVELLRRGIADDDIIVLDNPFPTASWSNMFPWEALTMYVGAAVPGSAVAQQNYLHLHEVLRSRGVGAKDAVIWIGHSAGGQMGLTLAHLASHLERFERLAGKAIAYRFEMVITLGTPIAFAQLPPHVKLRHYFSPEDLVVRLATRYGPGLLFALGYPMSISAFPARLNESDRIRIFKYVEHPYWDMDSRVVDCIVRETRGGDLRPWWECAALTEGLGMSLLRLVNQGVEMHSQITLEDPPSLWLPISRKKRQ